MSADVATVNPLTYIANAMQGSIIRGYKRGSIGQALLMIAVIGAISRSASLALFRRAVY
jgi:ABC-type multidrug transport system permease subunit